jgi:hypothetical protein
MEKVPLIKVPHHFPGMTVLVPMQANQQELVAINKGSLIPDTILKMDFPVIRFIANIALITRDDFEHGIVRPVTDFDPPIEFRVGYNFLDVMQSDCNIDHLKLAYWDGSHWEITNDNPIYEYQILPPSTGQVAEFKISSWPGDPPIAWGK